ncbi:uncharacterized protein LOC117725952 [Cyclopterus lumpus]|uniref:uncharacterized protein LOC117725952 n=1 Tax=Cyclopterus lumpus TaxID=8103 RepID=UPI001486781E|nr:uncharacterized protein LOC117725952 [Cyclopterus lumpus]
MNWVGGSRKRFVAKNDAQKQREFFEKRKMQNKLKSLGMALPDSPPRGTSSGGMDLVTLFIVNQIAARKEIKDPPKVAVFGSCKGGSKHKRNKPLVLPMSPCSPSQLSLLEGESQYSAQGQRKRKHVIPRGFKCGQLSPVLESAFSDNSASDYLPPMTDPLIPFSSISSASDQVNRFSPGIFPLQLNLQQRSQTQTQLPPPCSRPLWDTAVLGHTEFQPFSQPRGMTDCVPWSCGPNPPLYQMETPTAARVLFRSPERHNAEAWDQAGREVTFSLSQLEDKEPMLEFTLHQSETERQFEGEVFRGFSTEECEGEASHFGRGTSKIYLKDDTPAASSRPQTVPDSQCMDVEGSNHMHLSNCTDGNFSAACLEHKNNGCEYSPGYSCSGGYLSSDSDDDEECCRPPCLQAASSHMDHTFCANNLDSCFSDNQEVMGNAAFQVKGWGSNAPQFASPPALAQSQNSELCTCKKTPAETRDAGTQTVGNLTAQTCDSGTQCSAVAEASGLDSCLPPVDVSVQPPATGRQTDTAVESRAHTPSSDKWRSGEKHTPWTRKQSKEPFVAGSLSRSSFINKCTDGRGILQRPINPFLEALSMTDGGGKDNREERGQQENGLSNDAMEEVTSGTGAHGLSEEAETLQEIADILLLLKQRKEVTK